MTIKYSARVNLVKNPSSSIKAFATLIINDIIGIDGFRVAMSKEGNLFVGFPEDPPGPDGKRYRKVKWYEEKEEGTFNGPSQQEAVDAIISAYEALVSGNSSEKRNQAASAQSTRPNPTGARPSTPAPKKPVRTQAKQDYDW